MKKTNNDQTVTELYEMFYDREIEVVVDGKVIHRGFLKSCREKDFYYILSITKKKNERGGIVFLPYPFKMGKESDSVFFSYKLSDFSKDVVHTAFFKKKINQSNLRKYNFFDNIVTIRKAS